MTIFFRSVPGARRHRHLAGYQLPEERHLIGHSNPQPLLPVDSIDVTSSMCAEGALATSPAGHILRLHTMPHSKEQATD